jgi:hypothetical protein
MTQRTVAQAELVLCLARRHGFIWVRDGGLGGRAFAAPKR